MKCVRCDAEKPESDFYSRDRTCKVCRCALVRANRLAKLDKYREYDRQRSRKPERLANAARVTAEYIQEHPKRRAANIALGNAVRDGRVFKWPVCAIPECENTKVVGHHPDYDQPLSVVWLCQGHHKQTHASVREPQVQTTD